MNNRRGFFVTGCRAVLAAYTSLKTVQLTAYGQRGTSWNIIDTVAIAAAGGAEFAQSISFNRAARDAPFIPAVALLTRRQFLFRSGKRVVQHTIEAGATGAICAVTLGTLLAISDNVVNGGGGTMERYELGEEEDELQASHAFDEELGRNT